jgi:hypothetical protein
LVIDINIMEQFKARMVNVLETCGGHLKIVEAHSTETDPAKKRVLEVAGLYWSYVAVKATGDDATELGKRAAELWAEHLALLAV